MVRSAGPVTGNGGRGAPASTEDPAPPALQPFEDSYEHSLPWLRALVQYKLPPGRVLASGCGHGGLAALLRWAGFEAQGLEAAPPGPLEQQAIEPASLDVMAFLEGLGNQPDPAGFLRHCLRLLKPDGILALSSPRWCEEEKSWPAVASFPPAPDTEPLFIFDKGSLRVLFDRVGGLSVEFEPASKRSSLLLLACRQPLRRLSEERIQAALNCTPAARMVRTLLNLHARVEDETGQARDGAPENEISRVASLQNEMEEQQAAIDALGAKLSALHDEVHDLRLRSEAARRTLGRLRDSYVLRLMRRLHLWSWVETGIEQVMRDPSGVPGATIGIRKQAKLERVLVDLTPVLPGGDNGGAKIVAVNVAREMARLLPECEFILLTAERSHAELGVLDAANVRRLCVEGIPDEAAPRVRRRIQRFPRLLSRFLPGTLSCALDEVAAARALRRRGERVRELDADLLFCPFTAPYFADPAVPAVCVVHDLQFLYYPQFFDSRTRAERDLNFRNACRASSKVIAVSEYVRATILENSTLPSDRVTAVHNGLPHRLPAPSGAEAAAVLARFRLEPERYLLYPANFWLHKNHEMLFTALGIHLSRRPSSDLKLVCTGAPGARMEALQAAARMMKLADRIVFPGFIPEEDFAAILRNCRAVIFPSLYEGFGMPLLEAMEAGRPVLASNTTALPEVGGDAVLLFDPRVPSEMAEAIDLVESDADLRGRLVEAGLRRVAQFGSPEEIASRYLQVFREALGLRVAPDLRFHGVYPDGWTSERMVLTFPRDTRQRYLQLKLEGPQYAPSEYFSVAVADGSSQPADRYSIRRGEIMTIRKSLSPEGGLIEVRCDPSFEAESLSGADSRRLALKCRLCRVVSASGEVTALYPIHAA